MTTHTTRRTRLPSLLLPGCGIALLLATSLAAHAAVPVNKEKYLQMGLEQLMGIPVYAASKHQQSVQEAPSSVTIIHADEIRRYGYRNLGELLRSVPGFYFVQNRGSSGFVGTRGLNRTTDYGARFLLQLDGNRLTEPVYGSMPTLQDFPLDLDLIDRVEIVRGPGSSLHGSNAFFGTVNVITRRGKDVDGLEAALATGSRSTNSGRLTYGTQTKGGAEVLLSGTLYGSSGDRDLYFPEFDVPALGMDGHARNIDSDHAGTLFGRFSYKGLTFMAGHGQRDKQIPSGRFSAIFGDPNNVNEEERTYATVEYADKLPSQWELLARGSLNHYLYEGNIPLQAPWGAPINYKTRIEVHWLNGELQASRTFGQRHRITAGGEYQSLYDVEGRLHFEETNGAFLVDRYKDEQHFTTYAFFLQDEIRLADTLILNAGLRLDHYETFGDTVNPRLGLIFSPQGDTTFKLLYGRAFRAPTISEMFYQVPGDPHSINPYLDAETITTYEGIWEQRLSPSLHTSLSIYRNEIDDIINVLPGIDTITTYAYVNTGKTVVNGVEATIGFGKQQGIRGRLSYAYADAEARGSELFVENSPHHLIKANLITPLGSERYTLGLEAQYVSPRRDCLNNTVDEYWLVNATLFGRPLGEQLDLALSVYNLFDHSYRDPAGSPPVQTEQDDRTFRLKMTYRF
ncbi:MAG: TonB-dependent receptor plug domain-containing protein [Desulfobulbus sp.]|jgi:outer membrane receptor for ferrienterochelin and colicins